MSSPHPGVPAVPDPSADEPGPWGAVAPARPHVAWWALAATLVAGLVALLVPDQRAVLAVVSAAGAVVLVAVGVVRHRPSAWAPWLALGTMLALWGAGVGLAQVQGRSTAAVMALIAAGQAIAVGVTVRAVRSGTTRAQDEEVRTSWATTVDLLVIATVLALVAAQITAVAASTGAFSLVGVVVPTLDVAIIGILLRFVLTRRRLTRSTHLLLAGALSTTVYDLVNAVGDQRVALPGEPAQALGVVCLLLFGVAALHPSMAVAFDLEALRSRRQPSTAMLGLLPLVVVPLGLWWVDHVTRAQGLPTVAFLCAGALVAGLCLLRGFAALSWSEHLAEHDPLTDLRNRRGLRRAFDEAPPREGRSLLLVDVDEFKQVNDTHGHDVGDTLLLAVRDRLLEAAGDAGIVARLGGDEFVLLVRADQADVVTERVLQALRHPVHLDGLRLRTTASIGVARPGDGSTLSELLARADVAMYAAKAAGRDAAVTYRPHMQAEVAHRFALSSQVRQLLGGESAGVGQLDVHYQPLVELASGAVVGAEALVRWCHPDHGLLPPDAFLGVVATSGLDAQLDSAVLREVVLQLARWRDQGRHPVPVSVNLTRDSLLDPAIADRVVTALERHDIPPSLLHLEITEHEQLPDDDAVAENLGALRAAGVEVRIDDYGTGYTSLDYLRRFPVEVLKLDRSVTVTVTEQDGQVVAGIAAMARTLDLDVVAEGIETLEQRDRLTALGIRYGQGWLFAPPLPADEYADQVLGPAHVWDDAPAVPAPRLPADGRREAFAEIS